MRDLKEVREDLGELRAKLISQASDQIDMGDYKQQMRAYQIMFLSLIDLVTELTELRIVSDPSLTDHLPTD